MTRPLVHFYDNNTGEEIIREMNDAEYAQAQIDKAAAEAEAEAEAAEQTEP